MSDAHVAKVGQRLIDAGYSVDEVALDAGPTLVGYRSEFRMQWMATRVHTFVLAARVSGNLSRTSVEAFTDSALTYAVNVKGSRRGLQTGVAVIPILIADHVDPAAAAFAQGGIVKRFAALAWPAVVDLDQEQRYSHQGSVFVGGLYATWMRQQVELALPMTHF